MTAFHLAQMNVGTAVGPIDGPELADFMARLDDINALAERSPGFVWRLQSESGNATDIQVSSNPLFIVNMSVWESVEALFDYVYKTAHTEVMARRREWFVKPDRPFQVLWWVQAGQVPTPREGLKRLRHLERHGPGPYAFTFKSRFPPPQDATDAAE